MSQLFTITYVCETISDEALNNMCALLQQELPVSIECVKSVEEVFPKLSNHTYNTDIIAIDIEHFYHLKGIGIFDVINTLRTLLSCTVYRKQNEIPTHRKTKIIGVAGSDTDPALTKSIEKIVDRIAVRIGGKFTYEDVKEDVKMMIAGDNTMHKKMLATIKQRKKTKQPDSGIKLTPRQSQILEIVNSRGVSNKIIAKILKISESTVKLHVSAILKKYGVKNRTQLALFSKTNHGE